MTVCLTGTFTRNQQMDTSMTGVKNRPSTAPGGGQPTSLVDQREELFGKLSVALIDG